MYTEAEQEKKFVTIIIQHIAEKLHVKDPEQLQQRDYENLNLLIQEKTGINLSVSTLKRISKNQFQRIPQKNTLNALAQFLDYKDWYDFKDNHADTPVAKRKSRRLNFKFRKRALYIPVTAIVAALFAVILFNSKPAQSYAEASFTSRTNVSSGVPNTVIFDYDISMYDFDSAFIQQSWDARRRAEIKRHEKYSTSVYYYPGYHRAKIMINDQLVKEIPVYITTSGWLSLIQNPENDLIPIYVNENCINNNQIYISPETVKAHHIDLSKNNHATCFYYVNENFSGDSDNFSFESRVKNNIDEGALACQICEISIFAEYGRHVIQLANPGCIGSIFQKFGTEYAMGTNNDLSAFGTDLNNWNTVKLEISNKFVTVLLNDEEIYTTTYQNSNGALKGISYRFAGSGAVDYAKLSDNNDQLVFSEEFE
ncbi:hypothetical protein [Draconibacterium sediminis]|uniref:Uncharacterized protein n=1 Tax=Draconibacterium sediminis TaxID=1544798 RepID=A0A0D8J4Y0_9BACT|nr:hypothetical protein [Draconibacterium sediminis]KJF42015.1 hypothetical protein LH29_22300 [Draconibacterium sediminis]